MSDMRCIEELFGELIELQTSAERENYLNKLRIEDNQLERQLRRLLEAHEGAGSFLQSENAWETTHGFRQEHLLGSSIGPYKLRERLGVGGMGVVWAAEQRSPLKRKVAVKLIKPGMDSEQVIARFEAEREALSRMEHPNIASVLDAGTTENGHPYFVMELIRGVPVTEYCDAKRLTIRERLELFTNICHAVQHAHQKGIIHRDLKPSNVLVSEQDGKPILKVIDFGVAKALHHPLTDRSLYTGVFQALGTLQYMSPEQAGLSISDVDTRADVYGLGVLLYELLTGSTPFDKEQLASAAFDEACRIIREREPPKPSTRLSTLGDRALPVSRTRNTDPRQLSKLVRGDLDWIVSKALDKDRNRRYESANNFAGDINRYLNNEPIDARPPSLVYRASTLWKRNKSAVSAAIAIVLLLAIGLPALTWAYMDKTATLLSLHTQLIERCMEQALIGDEANFEMSLTNARNAGVPIDWIYTLDGIRFLHQGQNETAYAKFQAALDQNERNTSAWAMQSIAIRHLGQEVRWEQHMDREQGFPIRKRYEEIDKLSLAYASFYVNFDQCASDLGNLLGKHRSWFVARAFRAAALAEAAHTNGDDQQLAAAIEELRVPYVVADNNPLVLTISLFVHKVRLQSFGPGEDWLSREADRIVARLQRLPDYDLATHIVAEYHNLVGSTERALAGWTILLDSGGNHASRAFSELLRHGRIDDIRNANPSDIEAQVARACALALLGDENEKAKAKQTFQRIDQVVKTDFMRFRLLQLLLLLGDIDTAQAKCKEWALTSETNRKNRFALVRHEIFKDMVGTTTALNSNSEYGQERLLVNFHYALLAHANGDKAAAVNYLSKSISSKVGSSVTSWAHTLKELWEKEVPTSSGDLEDDGPSTI